MCSVKVKPADTGHSPLCTQAGWWMWPIKLHVMLMTWFTINYYYPLNVLPDWPHVERRLSAGPWGCLGLVQGDRFSNPTMPSVSAADTPSQDGHWWGRGSLASCIWMLEYWNI